MNTNELEDAYNSYRDIHGMSLKLEKKILELKEDDSIFSIYQKACIEILKTGLDSKLLNPVLDVLEVYLYDDAEKGDPVVVCNRCIKRAKILIKKEVGYVHKL